MLILEEALTIKKETNLTVNLSLAKEIAHQVILRNLSGIVLIDFIDMKSSAERKKVFKTFKGSYEGRQSKTFNTPNVTVWNH